MSVAGPESRKGANLNSSDRAWFETLVSTLGRPALKFAYMQVQKIDVAEEIVQESFARAWAAPNTPRDPVEFRRWLYRILTNLARDYFRDRQQAAALAPAALRSADPVDEAERRAIDASLAAALRSLTLGERQAIYLRYFEDQSFAETARILRRPSVSLRVVVHRALGKLRRRLEQTEANQRLVLR